MGTQTQIVVASQNRGKAKEIAAIFQGFAVSSLAEFDPVDFPEEGGDYFENARVKAIVAARTLGVACVADDSGLEVEALGGRPGAYSARYGGPGLDDAGRVRHLLSELEGIAAPRRARFFCVAAVARPDGRVEVAEGACPGEILTAPRGEGGFGYDPVFQPTGHAVSMAELAPAEKQALSHRGHAFAALRPALEMLLGGES